MSGTELELSGPERVNYAKRRLREAMGAKSGRSVRFSWVRCGRMLGMSDNGLRNRVVNGLTMDALGDLCRHLREGTLPEKSSGGRPLGGGEKPPKTPAAPPAAPSLDAPGWLPDRDAARDASYRARVCWLTLVRTLPRRCIGPHCAAWTEADNGASGFCGALPEHDSAGMFPPYMTRGPIGG